MSSNLGQVVRSYEHWKQQRATSHPIGWLVEWFLQTIGASFFFLLALFLAVNTLITAQLATIADFDNIWNLPDSGWLRRVWLTVILLATDMRGGTIMAVVAVFVFVWCKFITVWGGPYRIGDNRPQWQ